MEPREGLPPCIRLIVFDGRAVSVHDRDDKCSCGFPPKDYRFGVVATRVEGMADHDVTPSRRIPLWCIGEAALEYGTDDPDEAAAAFNRGREYVLTGVLE